MRTSIAGATFLALGGGMAAVGALDTIAIKGSDTLFDVTNDVLAACPNAIAHGITYIGTGSGNAESGMSAGTQTVGSMSRFLNPAAGVCDGPPAASAAGMSIPGYALGNGGTTAEGLLIGLDGIAIVAGATNDVCGGGLAYTAARSFTVTDSLGAPVVNCPGCDPGTSTYTIGAGGSSWKDVLATVFSGKTHDITDNTRRCGGDVRRSLVKNWQNLFEGACAGGPCPSGLKHAFRRNDASGTTDTFLGLVGLKTMPGPGANAILDFCNANSVSGFNGDSDRMDNDPIRIPCDANEDVCGRDGTIGLVTVVDMPENLPVAQRYTTALCGLGKFRLLKPATIGVSTCPNGGGLLFAKCFQPTIENADGTFSADCLARKTPVQGFGGAGMDGRAYNQVLKAADGTYRKDAAGKFANNAWYRLHAAKTIVPGAPLCTENDATSQIGCMARANGCAIGYAGREAGSLAPAGSISSFTVKGFAPTQANIEALVTTPLVTTDDYPLARKLFFTSVVGFENLTGGELELARCMADISKVSPAILGRHFIDVPGGILCQDFNETQANPSGAIGCGKASRTDACLNNVALTNSSGGAFPSDDPVVP